MSTEKFLQSHAQTDILMGLIFRSVHMQNSNVKEMHELHVLIASAFVICEKCVYGVGWVDEIWW